MVPQNTLTTCFLCQSHSNTVLDKSSTSRLFTLPRELRTVMLHSQLERLSSFNLSSNPLLHQNPVCTSCHNTRMAFPFCGWGPSTDCRIVGALSECKRAHPSSLMLLHTKPPNCMFSFQGYNGQELQEALSILSSSAWSEVPDVSGNSRNHLEGLGSSPKS